MSKKLLPERFARYPELSVDADTVLSISADSFWVSLSSETHAAHGILEGKLHLPSAKVSKLIIFEPGFPGGAATDFERLHVAGLLASGYAVFTARHRGVILNGPHSDYYVNCSARQSRAAAEKQIVLGDGKATMKDWFKEPLIALDALGKGFEEITIVGHSFGGLAIMHAACELFEARYPYHDRVKKLVHLAGVGGRIRSVNDQTIQRWHSFMKADWAVNRIEVGESSNNVTVIKEAHDRLHRSASVIPASIDVVCLTAYGDTEEALDELIPAQEALDIIVSLGHGTLIVDTTQRAKPDTGEMAHELFALKTDTLLKLVDPAWKSNRQIVRLDESGLS